MATTATGLIFPSTLTSSSSSLLRNKSDPFRLKPSRNPRHGSRLRPLLAPQAAFKVAVLGAGSDIGGPLSLLIKMSPLVTSLNLHDDVLGATSALAEHLNHCNTPCRVAGFAGASGLPACLRGADVVVLISKRAIRMAHEDDEFAADVRAVKSWAEAVADNAPEALVHVVSGSASSTVPVAAEVMGRKGVYDKRKIFGVTTLDVVRASTFVAERKGLSMFDVSVPVVGGHEGETILPLLSRVRPYVDFTKDEVAELTKRVQRAETEVMKAKGGVGSAVLSVAYATARFVESSLRGLDGEDVYECALVESKITEVPFFSSRLKLGRGGVEAVLGEDLEGMTEYEEEALERLKPLMMANIEKGLAIATCL